MSAHTEAQLYRFGRTTAYAFLAALAANSGKLSWWDLLSLAAGSAETGLRQVYRVSRVDQNTGSTP